MHDTVVTAHLKWLEMRGDTPASVYARERALARLTAWLESRGPVAACATTPTPISGRGSGSQSSRLWPPGGTQGAHPHYPSLSDPPDGSPGASLLHATAADLAAWRESLALGPGATVNYVSHVRNFYAFCISQGLRSDNPADGLPVPRLRKGIPRPIPEAELMRALGYATPRVRPWLVLAAWAGFRAREIAFLKRDCVLEGAQPPVLLVAADAAKGRRERLVPMSAFVFAELRAAGLPSSGYVFRRHDGRRGPNAPWLISHLANRALRESGTAATLHQLRHRYGTQLYRASAHDLRLTQDMLGHASPATTSIYAAWDRAGAAAAVDALPVPPRLRSIPSEEAL